MAFEAKRVDGMSLERREKEKAWTRTVRSTDISRIRRESEGEKEGFKGPTREAERIKWTASGVKEVQSSKGVRRVNTVQRDIGWQR